ncbi:MAG: hypothetical protein SNJ70_08880 [Armatimonadota bacterium]
MLKSFYTHLPLHSGKTDIHNESIIFKNNKWLFDKSVWQRMFRSMGESGFDSIVISNSDPFPFINFEDNSMPLDIKSQYIDIFKWIIENSLDYGISPYMKFNVLDRNNVQYYKNSIKNLLEVYPEIVGIIVDLSILDTSLFDSYIQKSIIDIVDSVRPDSQIIFSGINENNIDDINKLKRRNNREIKYSVQYTSSFIVDAQSSSFFDRSIELFENEKIIAEFRIENFSPWTSFSYETSENILENIEDLGIYGFCLYPIDQIQWPHCSDTGFKYQFQRDKIWYSVWGGAGFESLLNEGKPKWLLRNRKLIYGFQSASKIIEVITLYFAGNRDYLWIPQLSCMFDTKAKRLQLYSISDMLDINFNNDIDLQTPWQDITGDRKVSISEYIIRGTTDDSYGPEELIDEIADLAEQAVESAEKGMRNASGEKELPSLSKDAFCMGKLGFFYIERIRAALAHSRSEQSEAIEHLKRAIGMMKEIRAVDMSHRKYLKIKAENSFLSVNWNDIIAALEAEYNDALSEKYLSGSNYIVNIDGETDEK